MADLPSTTMAETARLKVLDSYRIIASDKHLQDLTSLATQLCNVPISLINLVGEDRLWSITAVGVDPLNIPKQNAFCDFAISSDNALVIPDTLADPRFEAHPLVVNAPNVRFYAALPLIVQGGFRIGTFCLVDGTPRQASDLEIENLRILRDAATTHLEYHASQQSGLSPVTMLCAWCDNVKASEDSPWQPLSDYLSEANLSHGMCPDCLADRSSQSQD